MQGPTADEPWVDPTWSRLEEQIDRYDRKGAEAQRMYKRLKTTQVVLAAFIPFLAGFQDALAAALEPGLDLMPAVAIALFGVAVVVLEGLQHLSQYYPNGLIYRATGEALKHEKFLFLADAGPYWRDRGQARAARRAGRGADRQGARAVGRGAGP